MRSTGYMIMEIVVRIIGYKRIFSLNAQNLRDHIEKARDKRKTTPPGFILKRHQTCELAVLGHTCYVISPKKAGPVKKAVLFLHGGGMFREATVFHWIVVSKLINQLETEVWFPVYPLVPECTYKSATEMLLQTYDQMLEIHPAEEITFLGDSVGAALGFMMLHHRNSSAKPQPVPGKLILVSPAMLTDIDAASREKMNCIAKHDPMLGTNFIDAMTEIMQLVQDENDYFSIPFGGDMTGFPSVHIYTGTYDIFYAQIPAIVRGIQAANVPVTLHIAKRMMHIWPYLPFCRESKKALDEIFHTVANDI